MNDYDQEDLPEVLMEDFMDSAEWNAGLIKIHGSRIAAKIGQYLNELAERLENACQTSQTANIFAWAGSVTVKHFTSLHKIP